MGHAHITRVGMVRARKHELRVGVGVGLAIEGC